MNYPSTFLKGISNPQDVVDGIVSAVPFRFDPKDPKQIRGLKLLQSIDWEDDNGVIPLLMNQTNQKGDIQFKAGLARVPISCVDYINSLPKLGGLDYEREVQPNNPYHGNLIIGIGANKPQRDIISNMLAGHAEFIPR